MSEGTDKAELARQRCGCRQAVLAGKEPPPPPRRYSALDRGTWLRESRTARSLAASGGDLGLPPRWRAGRGGAGLAADPRAGGVAAVRFKLIPASLIPASLTLRS